MNFLFLVSCDTVLVLDLYLFLVKQTKSQAQLVIEQKSDDETCSKLLTYVLKAINKF